MLLRRTKRRADRPLADRISNLLPQREPFYAQADITVISRDDPHDTVVEDVIAALASKLMPVMEKQQ